ncbi:taurine ABC transporter ATP-binding protein [Pseudarthrobacter sp. AB1]|nr:taurine ABC transporter ATP-binding protein [Pseudarthrobacter sp. AB1]
MSSQVEPAPTKTDRASQLSIAGVGLTYGSGNRVVEALSETTLNIKKGEFVCLVGPSGCGKTTLLHLLAGFSRPTSGAVLYDGQEIVAPSRERGIVFQQASLYPWMSVEENISFGLKLRGIQKSERKSVAERYIAMMGLEGFGDKPPYELSGGMRQRAAIARVLANDAEVMLMDEPFAPLDALTRERLQEELKRLWASVGNTVIFVTHSVDEAVYLGTRIVVFSQRPGRVILDIPRQVPEVNEYDGDIRTLPEFGHARGLILNALQEAHAI